MKQGKLLFLLAAVLSLSMLFVACDGADPAETAADSGNESSVETGVGSESAAADQDQGSLETETQLEGETHEMENYFDFGSDYDHVIYTSISRLDGTIEDMDMAKNLAVVVNKDLDTMNNVIKTVEVYDLLTGEVILSESISYAYTADPDDAEKTLKVTIEYPVIRVEKSYIDEGDKDDDTDDKTVWEISYYPACKGGELIHTTEDRDFGITKFYNGLVCVEMGDRYVWMDANLNVVRAMSSLVDKEYNVADDDYFRSEYKGYLYAYTNQELMIYNRGGSVCGTYTVDASDKEIACFVLNDGNVLIQEFDVVSVYEAYDFVLGGSRYVMKSMIMNCINGELTEIDLDYVVDYVETAYWQKNNAGYSSADLADGLDNLVWLYRVSNGNISTYASVCVMDNELNALYTVKNDTQGVNLSDDFFLLTNDRYVAGMDTEGSDWKAIFDLDGNLIAPYGAGNVRSRTEKYIVTNSTIYDYDMNVVYAFAKDGYVLSGVVGEKIYLSRDNFVTGKNECYVVSDAAAAPELLADGVSFELDMAKGDVYVLYDVENEVYRLYNCKGVELLVTANHITSIEMFDGVIVVNTTFDGENILYILK